MTERTIKQKLSYIKRHIDIIDKVTADNIYDVIKKQASDSSVRDTHSEDGIYVDIGELDDGVINIIYQLVEKRVNLVLLK